MARKKTKRSYGTGCVIKKANGLAIRWREPLLMPDGSIRRVLKFETLGSVSKKEAVQKLQDRLAACQAPRRGPVTFQELASTWKATVLPMYKYSTQKGHAEILEKRLLPHFGQFRIDRISRQDIQRFAAELGSSVCAPKSIHNYHGVLSTILTKAVEWNYIPHNPAHGVRLPRIRPVRSKWVLTREQAQQLLDRLPLLPRTLVGLALLTGARRGELFALRWKSFDATKQTLSIQEAVYDRVIDRPKTQGSIRTMPLSQPAVAILNEWFKAATKKAPDDFIFSTNTGTPKEPRQIVRDYILPVCRELGLPRASWLTFRRTFATLADENGASAKQRGELMGNSAEINANVYTQTTDEGLRRAVEDVGEALTSSKKNEQLFTNCSLSSRWVN